MQSALGATVLALILLLQTSTVGQPSSVVMIDRVFIALSGVDAKPCAVNRDMTLHIM